MWEGSRNAPADWAASAARGRRRASGVLHTLQHPDDHTLPVLPSHSHPLDPDASAAVHHHFQQLIFHYF